MGGASAEESVLISDIDQPYFRNNVPKDRAAEGKTAAASGPWTGLSIANGTASGQVRKTGVFSYIVLFHRYSYLPQIAEHIADQAALPHHKL